MARRVIVSETRRRGGGRAERRRTQQCVRGRRLPLHALGLLHELEVRLKIGLGSPTYTFGILPQNQRYRQSSWS